MLITTVSTFAGMFGLFQIYDGFFKNSKLKNALNEQIDLKTNEIDAILNSGSKGEGLLADYLAYMRKNTESLKNYRTWMPSDDNINSIVMKVENFTQEIDNLLLVENSLYIFEVKHWKGKIFRKENQLYQGERLARSPEEQTKTKILNLNNTINEVFKSADGKFVRDDLCEIYPIYVFTHDEVELTSNLNKNYVELNDLSYFLQKHINENVYSAEVFEFYKIQDLIKSKLDLNKSSKLDHMLNLAKQKNPPSDALKIKNSLNEIEKLKIDVNNINDSLDESLNNSKLGLILVLQFLVIQFFS